MYTLRSHGVARALQKLAGLTLCLIGLELGAHASVFAEAPPAKIGSLRWTAPTSCPGEQHVRETVDGWLAQSSKPSDVRGIAIDANVMHSAAGFRLDLSLKTPGGEGREQLVAERCETLVGVVALKVALTADPDGWLHALSAARAHARARSALRFDAGFGPGALPGLGPELELSGVLRWPRIALRLGAGYDFPNAVHYEALPTIGAHIDMPFLTGRLCAFPVVGRVEVPLCTGAAFGLMRGTGFGVQEKFTSRQLYGAWLMQAAWLWPIVDQLAISLGVEARVSLLRPSFHVRNLERLYVPEVLGVQAQLGVEWRLL